MAASYLSCRTCRIRMRASAAEVVLLEDRCPICEATLTPPSPPSEVMGFRSFDMGALSEQGSNADPPEAPREPADLVSRRLDLSKGEDPDTQRSSAEGMITAPGMRADRARSAPPTSA